MMHLKNRFFHCLQTIFSTFTFESHTSQTIMQAYATRCALLPKFLRFRQISTSQVGKVLNLVETKVQWTAQAVPIRGRPMLVGSDSPKFPEYLAPPRDGFPFVYEAAGGVSATAEECASDMRKVIDELLRKRDEGGVLFRGLPISTSEEFSRVVQNLGLNVSLYVGNAIRHQTNDFVYSASDQPPEWCIEAHNELAYTNYFPEKVMFFCLEPSGPGAGGESVITDVREILPRLDTDVVDKFRRLGIMYTHYVPTRTPGGYNSWQYMFNTDDRNEVEEHLAANNINWRWEENGALLRWITLPALRMYRGTELWFNSAHFNNVSYLKLHPYWRNKDLPDSLYPYNTYYGDGSDIEPEVLQHIRDVIWQVAVGFQMQKSDLLVLNNMYCQHARLSFTGPRKLAFAMAMQDD
ncbi:dapdiamide synthesis protein DdaC-like isoform X2 [Branchiostoma floridae x Branchiostoma belcheri]